jgi:hypothetical protein
MKFAIFRRNFNEILKEEKNEEKKDCRNFMEFHRNVQEMTNCLDILRKSARKIRKMLEISGIKHFVRNFHFSFHFFIRLPIKL